MEQHQIVDVDKVLSDVRGGTVLKPGLVNTVLSRLPKEIADHVRVSVTYAHASSLGDGVTRKDLESALYPYRSEVVTQNRDVAGVSVAQC